jgi:hypothetical protein
MNWCCYEILFLILKSVVKVKDILTIFFIE